MSLSGGAQAKGLSIGRGLDHRAEAQQGMGADGLFLDQAEGQTPSPPIPAIRPPNLHQPHLPVGLEAAADDTVQREVDEAHVVARFVPPGLEIQDALEPRREGGIEGEVEPGLA